MLTSTSPTVSVIVPLYNKEKWVARCLSSVFLQSYRDFELIVVNDGSTDAGTSIVRTFHDHRMRLIDKENGGEASARNNGIKNARGRYIAFIDADDEWQPDHLLVLLAAMSAYPDAVVVCDEYRGQEWTFANVSDGAEMVPVNAAMKTVDCHRFHYLDQMTAGVFVTSCSSTMVSAATLHTYGVLFNEGMKRGVDLNFWIKLSGLGDFIYCDFKGAIYHRDDFSSEMNRSRKEGEAMPDYFSGMARSDFNADQLKRIKHFLAWEYMKNAYQNRCIPFKITEMKTMTLGKRSVLFDSAYLMIRFAPRLLLRLIKQFKTKQQVDVGLVQ